MNAAAADIIKIILLILAQIFDWNRSRKEKRREKIKIKIEV